MTSLWPSDTSSDTASKAQKSAKYFDTFLSDRNGGAGMAVIQKSTCITTIHAVIERAMISPSRFQRSRIPPDFENNAVKTLPGGLFFSAKHLLSVW